MERGGYLKWRGEWQRAHASLNPANTSAGSAGFTLNVSGSNFVPTSVVRWNGQDLVTTYVDSGALSAAVPVGALTTADSVGVTVFTPTPGGGLSSALTFTVKNPAPSITTLSPSSVTAGSAGFSLTVNGANFVSGAMIRWNGVDLTTIYISATQLSANISADKVASAETASVIVYTPVPGGGLSSLVTFTINNLVPSITTLSPSSVTAGSSTFTLTVNGATFVSGSLIRWNGVDLTTTYISASQLSANISAEKDVSPGTVSVTVFTSSPGGGVSNTLTFTILPIGQNNPLPQLSQLSLASVTSGASATLLTLTGANFIPVSVVRWNGTDLATTYINSAHLTVTLGANLLTMPGTYTLTVFNSTPGGGESGGLTFTVELSGGNPFHVYLPMSRR